MKNEVDFYMEEMLLVIVLEGKFGQTRTHLNIYISRAASLSGSVPEGSYS